jgi:hypothetical protein
MLQKGEGWSFCIQISLLLTEFIGLLFSPALGPQQESWLVLIRQTCFLLLRSVADFPQ